MDESQAEPKKRGFKIKGGPKQAPESYKAKHTGDSGKAVRRYRFTTRGHDAEIEFIRAGMSEAGFSLVTFMVSSRDGETSARLRDTIERLARLEGLYTDQAIERCIEVEADKGGEISTEDISVHRAWSPPTQHRINLPGFPQD